ncbi:DUF2785 domain-containing protein [Lactiplantibacillus paraplantarum]|uniref:DUF2785 domain-containing protein n=1 Tax=Lactiplantibacillus paraplantarum TaxID=60520 RepID=A0AAD0X8F3_9LACO|nr:DUF2785 domain-containing protein [Lactiplantibacillus paraplantarum]AVW10819.1 DUF2785 domain-containing protein [Lactiplantibacillus paraplantarum]AYJ39171.1 DUF2785 domain-containing protein [Lactiplantibacillus paraplantarum]ERL43058.1 hypothetical protein N644_2940 [Lactiplantibacillus paraplantarum]KRL47986.1 hypothetical protein FD48_GL001570 [Lactiplantibacillus paraplantarum DSM 10667]MCU4684221.1 DUF2785 domain-containing protein [Lactiplantibacillus paraplantarum]
MQAEKLMQVKNAVLKLRQQLRAGQVYQSLPARMDALIKQLPSTVATTVTLPGDEEVLPLIATLHEQLKKGTLTAISSEQVKLLMAHIGSRNPQVRDQGVYYLLNEALQQQVLTPAQLGAIFDQLIQDQLLFAHIDEPQNDAVYQRSFAVLLLSVLLYADHAGLKFMTPARLDLIVTQMTIYILLETDTRGFVGTTGWAHAYTHIGNILDELADESKLARADKLLLLAALLSRYQKLTTPLIFGEPERLSTYLTLITNKDELYCDYLLAALKEWHRQLMMHTRPSSEAEWTQIFNRNRLLEALALHDDLPTAVVDYLDDELEFLG